MFSAATEGIFNLFLLTNKDQSRTESTFTTARATASVFVPVDVVSASSPSAEEVTRQPKSSALQAGWLQEPRSSSLKPADKRTNTKGQKNRI